MHTSNFITKLEERSKKLCKLKNDIQVVTFGLEEKLSSKSDRATQNNNKISTLNTDIINDENQLSDIKRVLESEIVELETTEALIIQLEARRNKIESEIGRFTNAI